jgi:DNA-binding beta-propeller fold protein YncE
VFRFSDDGTGRTVSEGGGINGPLGLAIAPGGDILVANSNDGNLVETTPSGNQVAVQTVNPAGAGSLFGLAVAPHGAGIYLVDDALNNLDLLH